MYFRPIQLRGWSNNRKRRTVQSFAGSVVRFGLQNPVCVLVNYPVCVLVNFLVNFV